MNMIDQKQAAIFVVVFFVIALLINSTQGLSNSRVVSLAPVSISPEAQQAAANAAQAAQVAQAAAAEHARYIARYLNSSFARQAGNRGVAIVVTTENGKLNSTVASALARRFQGASVQIFSSFFTPEFVSDGLFNDALAGSRELFRKLDLANSVNALVLAREDVQYSQNAALNNVTTATMRLDVTVVPVSGQSDPLTWTFTAYGPGFSQEVARKAAEERLIKQIAADTKMSLN
jgi:Na+-transporting methylmalonyl-CoA/oxaloacetate decarboxylase gamma subunit